MTLEEYAWRMMWLECGRLYQYCAPSAMLKIVRRNIRRAKSGESALTNNGKRTEWTVMVEGWFRQENQ